MDIARKRESRLEKALPLTSDYSKFQVLSRLFSLDSKAQRVIDKGAFGFIQKPFDIPVFSKAVKDALSA
jgi:DNA-binding NtrC family response regulator